jgi:hypothetical protein
VNTNKRPAIRQDDPGIHAACCGQNTWSAVQGSATVFINGKPAVRQGDQTKHCGGIGKIIEGSPNVIIGGSATVGGASPRNGGGAGSSGSGSGGSGGGGSTGGTSGSHGGAEARVSSNNPGNGASIVVGSGMSSSGSGTSSDGAADLAKQQYDEHVFVVSAEVKSPGGTALAGETVFLLKHGTDEQVAGPFTLDANGRFGALVPENADYDIQVVDDGPIHHRGQAPDAVAATLLHVQIIEAGAPAAGALVYITGPGVSHAVTLGPTGELDLPVQAGEYDIKVGKQTFKAHTLNGEALARGDSGGYYQFAIESELDQDEHERARADRFSPGEREED